MNLIYKELDDEVSQSIDKLFPKKDCFIETLPGNVILPRKFSEIGDQIRDLRVYDDDVWLISYPRTGSTWAQEMIWLLGNNLNFEGAQQIQQVRSPLIELSALFSEDHHEWVANSIGTTVNAVKNMPRPRFARSHLPWCLLPKDLETVKPKIIYTTRNPKDLCVSFYYYCKLMHGLSGPFEDFFNLFLDDKAPIGNFWKHVLPFWKRSNDENVLFLKYEDMKRDLPAIIRKCAKFLNVNYELSNEDLQRICDHLKFDKMQKNPAVNLEPLWKNSPETEEACEPDANGNVTKFIRKGQIGDWKNHFTEEMNEKFDKWIDHNSRGCGLNFDYE